MQFQFDSFQDFMAMDGHGFYVWLTYAIIFTALTVIAVLPTVQRKKFVTEQRQQARRLQQQESSEH